MIVTTEDAVAGLVPKVPVMPVGQLDGANVTALLKPFAGVMVTVEVPVNPATAVAVVALIEKVGAAVTVSEIVAVLESAPDVPFTVSG